MSIKDGKQPVNKEYECYNIRNFISSSIIHISLVYLTAYLIRFFFTYVKCSKNLHLFALWPSLHK